MEEEDIELWYEEKKQKLSELYIKSIEGGMSVEQREQKFNRAMEKLNAEYNKKHTKFLKTLDNKNRRAEFRAKLANPFKAIGRGLVTAVKFTGHGVGNAFKDSYAQVHFNAKLTHIKHSHKIMDRLAYFFRPLYYFYAKHIKLPLLVLASPFVRIGRFFKRKAANASENVKKAGAVLWKYTKIAAKFTATHAVAAQKKISARLADWGKRYHEWQSKRVQAHLEKKQTKKEEKEKKLKEKGEQVQAAPKNIDQADAASMV
jgi:hypothetical protein